tara:strand:- start:4478 stop:4717 length:240 start_codon:yes stop_codon:yes gene_type:complete
MAKLEEKKLQELQQAIAKPNQIANEIGMRVIAYKGIDKLVDNWHEAESDKQSKMKEIEDEHGKINLDIATGEITKLEDE